MALAVEFRQITFNCVGLRRTLPEIAMADEPDDTKDGEVRFKAGPQLWAYLGWLSRHTLLGKTHNEVAEHVLRRRLSEMREEDFKSPDKP
jgi:hypothetical protein